MPAKVDSFGQSGDTLLEAKNCHFMKMKGNDIRTAAPWSIMMVESCTVDKPEVSGDLLNMEVSK